MRALRRLLGVLVSLIVLMGLVITGVLVARRTDERPSTYDASIQAYIVNMASEVSGRIVELNVLDNQQVKEGQVLFQIDPKPYQLSVDQARAAVQGLEAQLAVMTSEVASQTSGAEAAATGIGTASAQLALAASTLDRLEPLLKRGFVTAEQVDQARTAKESAQIALDRARQLAAQARQGITSTKPTEAQIDGARACGARPPQDCSALAMQRSNHRASSRRRGIRKYWSSPLHYH